MVDDTKNKFVKIKELKSKSRYLYFVIYFVLAEVMLPVLVFVGNDCDFHFQP